VVNDAKNAILPFGPTEGYNKIWLRCLRKTVTNLNSCFFYLASSYKLKEFDNNNRFLPLISRTTPPPLKAQTPLLRFVLNFLLDNKSCSCNKLHSILTCCYVVHLLYTVGCRACRSLQHFIHNKLEQVERGLNFTCRWQWRRT